MKVKTKSGFITSFREAWQAKDGRPVYTWRTDGDMPFEFESADAARAFIDAVWHGPLTAAEKRARDEWEVVPATLER